MLDICGCFYFGTSYSRWWKIEKIGLNLSTFGAKVRKYTIKEARSVVRTTHSPYKMYKVWGSKKCYRAMTTARGRTFAFHGSKGSFWRLDLKLHKAAVPRPDIILFLRDHQEAMLVLRRRSFKKRRRRSRFLLKVRWILLLKRAARPNFGAGAELSWAGPINYTSTDQMSNSHWQR